MACENPQLLWIDSNGNSRFFGSLYEEDNMVYYKEFMNKKVDFGQFFIVGCGKCRSCRIEHSRCWSLRCKDELSLWDSSCFITLTYNDEHLPKDAELCKLDYQLFFKRLRKYLDDERKKIDEAAPAVRIAYFGCGEYGRENLRPHYHFIVYGWCPIDGVPWSFGRAVCYRSALLDRLWSERVGNEYVPIGYATFGNVTDESINYVTRYSLKKLDLDTSSKSVRPFTVCSSRPGIGLRWLQENFRELLVKSADGAILRYGHVHNGRFLGVPRYYAKKFLDEDDKLALREHFSKVVPLVTLEDLKRRKRYSAYLQRSQNTHYGLDSLAHVETQKQ